MKRPILTAVVGYVIGIILGLYLNFSIVLLYLFLFIIFSITKIIYIKFFKSNKFSFYSISRYFKYIKLIINKKVIIIICISSVVSNLIVITKNNQYEAFYNNTSQNVEITAKITSEKQEKDYNNVYKIETINVNNKEIKGVNLYLNTNKTAETIEYGDKIKIKGEYIAPTGQRNYGGFSYKDYLKTMDIYGTVKANSIEIISKDSSFSLDKLINNIQNTIKINAKKYLPENVYSIYLGLILGDTSYIENNTKEAFRDSNMAHILAVSGMHVTYIIIGISFLLNKILGKRKSKIITIFILLFYSFLTGLSPSITRATIMAVVVLLGGVVHKKVDTWTSIAVSLFVILVYNPFLITNIGLQFSYLGTFGILILYKSILKIISRKDAEKSNIEKIIAISISAQIFILPLSIYHFNTFGIYFIITNLLLSFLIGPIIIYGFIFLILLMFNIPILQILSIPLNLGIQAVLLISNISKLPLYKIYVRTPQVLELIIFYVFVLIANSIYQSQTKKNKTNTGIRIKLTFQLIKYNIKKHIKKAIVISAIVVILVNSLFFLIPKELKIHFVDVGQGDCCFIETPENKTILIDGGGSEFGSFDVGKSTLLPYVLDRGYTKIDYVIISHFDTDHVRSDC